MRNVSALLGYTFIKSNFKSADWIACCETINTSCFYFIFYDRLKKNSDLCIKKSVFPYFPYIMVCILTWSSSKRHRMLD